jgi:hypothetical protein
VVVYQRELWEIGESLFPPHWTETHTEQTLRLLRIEVGRELATMVMFLGLAFAVARTRAQWWAAVLIAFGAWDIFYYVWLKVLIAWPGSLGTWDVLFLIPGQMTGPVYAPLSVAVLMTAAGVLFLHCENEGHRVRFGLWFWVLFLSGLALVFVSFFTNGFPTTGMKTEAELTYWCPLLVLGDGCGVAAMLWAVRELFSKREPDAGLYQSRRVGEE